MKNHRRDQGSGIGGRWCAIVLVLATTTVTAQAPDFTGTWVLDQEKSLVVATAGLIGLISAGVPATLHITQPANGAVVIESQVNEQHVRIYKPGGETSTPAGQGGAVMMKTRWDGRTLISEGAMKAPNGDTTIVREVMALGADGALTIQIHTTATDKAASSLVYKRVTNVGPCESWPTPCKRPSP